MQKVARKKQGGFMIMSLFIVISVLSLFLMSWADYQAKRKVAQNIDSFYNRVLYLERQIHAFASARFQSGTNINSSAIFPYRLSELEGDFIPKCSVADNKKGLCTRYNQTPWGEIKPSQYRVVGSGSPLPKFYYAELDISLPPESDERFKHERSVTLSMFSQMPNIRYDKPSNIIRLRIDRPDKAFGYDSLVKRSGDDSTMWGDWDFGGQHGITNVVDYTLSAADKSQISVSKRLVTINNVSHGKRLLKPKCSKGASQKLILNVSEVNLPSTHKALSKFKAYVMREDSRYWTIGLDVTATNKKSGDEVKLHVGEATALIQCI
ncbi:type II secretion system protein [Vibrio atlanticus]|uniref:type II secretion system protein n=1 Tax=Vibrio atlanticus TaxID=693153 RepID=UPI00354CE915